MCEIGCEFGDAKIAHNLAKSEGPPPLAVVTMLGLTRTPGQANAACQIYDFSLDAADCPDFSGLCRPSPGDGNL